MSAPDVQLRRALPEDAPAIAAIWHLGWRDGHLGHVPPELTAARRADSFRIRAAQQIGDTTVAVIGGQVAGFTMVVGGEVEQVYVDAMAGPTPARSTTPRRVTTAPSPCRRSGT